MPFQCFVHFTEATIPRIETADAMVAWYNRESREVIVGSTVEVLSGTKVTLTCQYSGFPEPAVKWNVLDKEGQVMKQDEGHEVINGSLVLTALQPSDSAEYVCSVRNVAGTSSASTKLKVFGKEQSLFLVDICLTFLIFRVSYIRVITNHVF